MTPTTPTPYRPLPTLPARAPGEAAEAYGLRALLFIACERLTATVDTEGLELAAHCFRLAVCNRDLTPTGADRLADVGRLISRTLAQRASEAPAIEAPAAVEAPAGADRPNLGPMAPLAPRPTPQPPQAPAMRPPVSRPAPAPPVRLAPLAPLAGADLF